MKKLKKNYKIGGKYFYQTEPTYKEDTEIKKLIKESGLELPTNEEEFPKLIDKLYTEKPDLFIQLLRIILKIDNSNIWKRIKNRILKNKDFKQIIFDMTKGEIAVILADFFSLRLNWIFDLLNLQTDLESQTKFQKMMEQIQNRLKSVSTLQTMTMNEQKN